MRYGMVCQRHPGSAVPTDRAPDRSSMLQTSSRTAVQPALRLWVHPDRRARNFMSDSLDTPTGTLPPAGLSLTTPAGLQAIDVLTRRRQIVFALNAVTYA